MRSRVLLIIMFTACALTNRTHAERVTSCAPALAEIFAETHGESSDQTPPTFEQKKEAFLSIYRAATEGLSIEELEGLSRQLFEFINFVDATNLSRAHEKLTQLKKILPSFSSEEQRSLMHMIQEFLTKKISHLQKSQKIWNKKREKERRSKLVQILRGHRGWVKSVAFSADSTLLASSADDSIVRICKLNHPTAAAITLTGYGLPVAFSPDGTRIASGNWVKAIQIWNLNKPTASPTTLTANPNSVYLVAFSPDGRFLASGDNQGITRLWDLTKDTPTSITLNGNTRDGTTLEVRSIAFSPDGTHLASGDEAGIIRIWNLTDPAFTAITLKGHTSHVNAVAFSPDGTRLASGGDEYTTFIWDLKNRNAPPISINFGHGHVSSVAFSPDGKFVVSGSFDKTIRIGSLKNPRAAPIILKGHTGYVLAVAFSPDGKFLASGSEDTTIRIWKWPKIVGLGPDRLEEDTP